VNIAGQEFNAKRNDAKNFAQFHVNLNNWNKNRHPGENVKEQVVSSLQSRLKGVISDNDSSEETTAPNPD